MMTTDTDVDRRFVELRTDLRDGFKEVNGKLDTLVTRSEHAAEVRRLDGRLDAHADQFKSIGALAKWAIGLGVSVGMLVLAGIGVLITILTRP